MCGIAGLVGPALDDPAGRRPVLEAMAGCLRHRGPDDSGHLEDGPVGLVHRRLAVLGLGPSGAQPMRSASGRYVVTYNGELYNHLELRRHLEREGSAPTWRGGSDTETLLAGVEAWGLEAMLQRSVGMFAFAIWDRERRTVTLVRDRLGEKPLSWAIHDGRFIFASQPSALRVVPGFAPSISPDALADLLRYGQVPGERTIHREIRGVAPGTLVEIALDGAGALRGAPNIRTWWSFDATARAGLSDPFVGSDDELVDAFGDALADSVRGQLLSDVPVGAFLSGGIDSSLVVATMCRVSSRKVRTFTIGFTEDAYDESLHARTVAKQLGTEHTELILSASDALELVPELPRVYDEPFGDASQLPTLLVSRLARGSVTVALSGDGGDELLAGYDRYARAERQARIPRLVALGAAAAFALIGRDRERRAALTLGRGPAPIVRRMLTHNPRAEELVPGVDARMGEERFLRAWDATEGLGTLTSRSMALDTTGYLPDDILHKVDRAAMAVSLETRVPLLDHRLVSLAWRLPMHAKVRDGRTKWILRELLARQLPRSVFERPKAGFAVPVGDWLRGPLRPWAEDLLAPDRLRSDGLLDVAGVRRIWEQHRDGKVDRSFALWPILMFRAWREAQ